MVTNINKVLEISCRICLQTEKDHKTPRMDDNPIQIWLFKDAF